MKLIQDSARFEALQAALTTELVTRIRIKLLEAGIGADQLEDLTASLALSLTGLIDDLAAIDADGLEVHPYLTFRVKDEELIHCGENAYTSEQFPSAMRALFRR